MAKGVKGFTAGASGNPNGRTKGVQNAVTISTKEIIFNAIDNMAVDFMPTMEQIKRDNPLEWAKIVVKLMDFVLPKKLDVTSGGKIITVIPPNKRTE